MYNHIIHSKYYRLYGKKKISCFLKYIHFLKLLAEAVVKTCWYLRKKSYQLPAQRWGLVAMVKFWCFNILTLLLFYMLCLLCMVLLSNIRSTFPQSLFFLRRWSIKEKLSYTCFPFEDFIICNLKGLLFVFFTPQFLSFFDSRVVNLCTVYRINDKNVYIKNWMWIIFESLKWRLYHIFLFEFNFKNHFLQHSIYL